MLNFLVRANLKRQGETPMKKGHYIFRASKVLPDGTKIFARDYGKKAFKIWIDAK